MDYREQSLRRRFSSAAQHLSVKPEQMVSLKLRETVNSYDDYRHLMDTLQHEGGLEYSEIQDDLQGRGYLLGHGKTKVIVVEHETGLELLYIAGSIASLIGLVPIVLQGWRALRKLSSGRHGMSDHCMEIRRVDNSGHLREERFHNRHLGSPMELDSLLPALSTTASLIDTEIKALSEQIQTLRSRVDVLERKGRRPGSSALRKKTKSEAKKSRGKTGRKATS